MTSQAPPSHRIGVIGIADGWSTTQLLDALEARTGYRRLIEMQDVVLDLEHGRVLHRGFDLSELDGIIVKKIAATYNPDALDRVEMLRVLEHTGVRVFSRAAAMMRLIDRLSCTVKLRLGQIPMPATTVTESVDEAVAAITRYGAAVAKPLYTSKARGMLILRAPGSHGGTLAELREQVEVFRQDNPVMYLQQLLDTPGRDLGVVFLGGEYLATYSRVSGGSWTTSTDTGGKYQPYQPNDEIIALAHRAQTLFELDFTCVDVVETAGGPKVFEVSAFGGFRGLLAASNIDAAARYADYAVGVLDRARARGGARA
jgi:tetrahydromethanopterin:alpha-L-glutamate ligase